MAESTTHCTFGDMPDYSMADLSRAFRNLARKLHPDKNPFDIEQFKEITQIYKIMCTPELRRLYYLHGSQAVVMDTLIFSEDCHMPLKCEDLYFNFPVTDDDLINGSVEELSVIKQQRLYVAMSNEHYGKSKSIFYLKDPTSPKPVVDFSEVITMIKTLKVDISKGMDYGQKITLEGEGEEMPRRTPGDLIVVLVKKNDVVDEQKKSSEIDQINDVEPTESSP